MTSYYDSYIECNGVYGATWNNKELVVELLIEEIEQRNLSNKDIKFGEVFKPGPRGKNALHLAAFNGNFNILMSLLKLAYRLKPDQVVYP